MKLLASRAAAGDPASRCCRKINIGLKPATLMVDQHPAAWMSIGTGIRNVGASPAERNLTYFILYGGAHHGHFWCAALS
jgi:hypothetical protein